MCKVDFVSRVLNKLRVICEDAVISFVRGWDEYNMFRKGWEVVYSDISFLFGYL